MKKVHKRVRIEAKPIIEFDTSELLPVPKGYTRISDPSEVLKTRTVESILDDERIMKLRERAEADKRLQKALGEGSRFMIASLADTGKKRDAAAKFQFRLEYFNYLSNRAVHVWLSEDEVIKVQVQPDGYQPPESDEEISTAAEIVRQDPQYMKMVEGLPVLGILAQAPEGQRYLFLLFKRPEEPATFSATVSLTARKVVKAGPIVTGS